MTLVSLWKSIVVVQQEAIQKTECMHFSAQTHSDRSQAKQRLCVFVAVCGLNTHRKRIIPVLDIAKASPRIPLPIMALLRLKTDMPNDVFPSNCKERMLQTDQLMKQIQSITLRFLVFSFPSDEKHSRR